MLLRDVSCLDRGAVLQNCQQRQDGALRKIRVLEQAAGVADHIAELEIDRLQMGIQPLSASGHQGAQQAIASQVMVRRDFGHLYGRFLGVAQSVAENR
jgi:hypothetical protein